MENVAAMVRAQNDLFMVTVDAGANSQNDNSLESLGEGKVTRAEYLRSAGNICHYLFTPPRTGEWRAGRASWTENWPPLLPRRWNLSVSWYVFPWRRRAAACRWSASIQGSSVTFELNMKERGAYALALACRVAGQGSLAQVPMTLSQDRQIIKTISLTGEDREWRTEEIVIQPSFFNTIFLKFFFGQGRMEIREARLTLLESKEEDFRAARAVAEEAKE